MRASIHPLSRWHHGPFSIEKFVQQKTHERIFLQKTFLIVNVMNCGGDMLSKKQQKMFVKNFSELNLSY